MGKEPNQLNRNARGSKPDFTKLDWRSNTSAAIEIHWSDTSPTQVALVIDAVTRGGGAIMFGRTSDGGALSVLVLQDSDKLKRYPKTNVEWEELADMLVDAYTGR